MGTRGVFELRIMAGDGDDRLYVVLEDLAAVVGVRLKELVGRIDASRLLTQECRRFCSEGVCVDVIGYHGMLGLLGVYWSRRRVRRFYTKGLPELMRRLRWRDGVGARATHAGRDSRYDMRIVSMCSRGGRGVVLEDLADLWGIEASELLEALATSLAVGESAHVVRLNGGGYCTALSWRGLLGLVDRYGSRVKLNGFREYCEGELASQLGEAARVPSVGPGTLRYRFHYDAYPLSLAK